MKKNNAIFYLLCLTIIIYSCSLNEKPKLPVFQKVNDSSFVVHKNYQKGDTRRYGVFPDSIPTSLQLQNLHTLIHKGFPIIFSKGNYPINIELKGAKNVSILFKNATINGIVSVIEKGDVISENINLKGKVTILDKIFIRKSTNINFEDVTVKSNAHLALTKQQNRGVSIYAGSKNITFKKLAIFDTGATPSNFFKYTAAALQVHGWNNNPENITIQTLTIKNAGRTAAYITGTNHKIKNTEISNYGKGNSKNMFGLEDAKEHQEKIFTGLWINKCNNCTFNKVKISTKNSKEYALKLGLGLSNSPTIIDTLSLDQPYKNELILDDILTNVLVKKIQVLHD